MAAQTVSVRLPDTTTITADVEQSATISECLRQLLKDNDRRLRRRARLARISYSEWRLTLQPTLPASRRMFPDATRLTPGWSKRDLALLYKPLSGTLSLRDIDCSKLLLVHVLSVVPVHLNNIPNAQATILSIPMLTSMTVAVLQEQIMSVLSPPDYLEDGKAVKYTFSQRPSKHHVDLTYLDSVELRSDMPTGSWLGESLSRPTSIFGWFAPVATEAPTDLKSRISAPVAVHLDTAKESKETQSSDSSAPCQIDQMTEQQFLAFLDDLQIPESKRQSLYSMPIEKRNSLFALDRRYSVKVSEDLGQIQPITEAPGSDKTLKIHNSQSTSRPTGRSRLPNVPDLSCQRGREADDDDQTTTPKARTRSKSPIRVNMSVCPPKLEWTVPKSPLKQQGTGSSWITSWWSKQTKLRRQTNRIAS